MKPSAVERVRAEYLEMPGLQLTPGQVHRLCGIERVLCEEVLATLVHEDFLYLKTDGRYARLSSDDPRPRQAKAQIRESHARRTA